MSRRPDHAAGDDRRPARRLRGDGRGADPLRLLGQHQGAPRLLDRALRRARRAGHAGRAHPRPPRLDARRGGRRPRRGAAPRRRLDPQRPLPGRHPPARHHADLAGLRRRRAARLRRLPRPPRRRRRADPGGDARPLEDAGGGGRGDPAHPGRAERARATSRTGCAPRTSASPTCAPRKPPTGSASGGSRSSPSATASDGCATAWTRSSPTPSAAPGRRWRRSPTAPTRAEDVLEDDAERRGARRHAAGRGDDRRRSAWPRLQRHRPPGRGQPQLPALGDQIGGLLRGAGAHRPRRAALGRRLPADRGARPRGLPAQRPLPGRRGGRQRRDLEPGRRPGDRRPRRRPRRFPPRARGR